MSKKEVKLKDLLLIFRNGASIKQFEGAEGLPITRIETISDATINPLKVGYANIYDDKYKDYYLQEGDILLSHINSVTHLGKCAIYENPIDKLIHGMNLLMLRAKQELILPKYLYYVLNSKQFRIQLPKITKKSVNQASMTVTDIGNINLLIEDDIEQQQKIVDILDKADEIRTKKRLANDKLDEFLKSTFIDMFGDPIRNDKDWNRYKMESLMTIKRGGSPRPIEKFLGGEYHWIKIGDATKNSSIYIYNTKEKIIKEGLNKTTFLPKGSLIFANCGVSLGFARILKIDGCIHDGWLSFSDIDESLNKIFLLKTLNHITDYFRKIAPDGTQPNLNTYIMKNFEVIVPPIELQNKFAKIVEKVEAQKQKNELVIEQMDNLFNSLSQRAFKGDMAKSNVIDSLTRQTVLHSKIIDKCNSHQTFGAVKLEKIFNLCDMIQELNLVPNGYYRKAAGPYVPEMRHTVEQELLQNNWVKITNQGNGKKVEYKKDSNFTAYKAIYNQIFNDKNQEIENIINYFYDKDTNYCEAFSTLYMCWNDLILEGENPTKTEIIDEFKNHWAPEKQRFERIYLLEILSDMSNQGFEPQGHGVHTIESNYNHNKDQLSLQLK